MARHKTTDNTASPKPAANAAAAAQPGPGYDVEAVRQEIARKLEMFGRDWRRCTQRVCRRYRTCKLPGTECFAPRPPERPMSETEWGFVKAKLLRDLKRRLAEVRKP